MSHKETSPYLDQASPWGNTGEALTFSVGQWNDFFCWSQMCTVGSLSPETAFLWRESIAKIAKLPQVPQPQLFSWWVYSTVRSLFWLNVSTKFWNFVNLKLWLVIVTIKDSMVNYDTMVLKDDGTSRKQCFEIYTLWCPKYIQNNNHEIVSHAEGWIIVFFLPFYLKTWNDHTDIIPPGQPTDKWKTTCVYTYDK